MTNFRILFERIIKKLQGIAPCHKSKELDDQSEQCVLPRRSELMCEECGGIYRHKAALSFTKYISVFLSQ